MTAAENLRKAAALLREHGWADIAGRFRMADGSGAMCLMGAVHLAVNGDADTPTSCDSPEDMAVVRAIGCRHSVGAITWNAEPGRTADEVIALLEKAAALAEVSW